MWPPGKLLLPAAPMPRVLHFLGLLRWPPATPMRAPQPPTRHAQFLCNGLEEDIQRRKLEAGAQPRSELEQLVAASGKMVLLHKLLPKLRAEGHKVLVFSQVRRARGSGLPAPARSSATCVLSAAQLTCCGLSCRHTRSSR